MCHTPLARCCRTKILRGFSYCILPIDHFPEDDFLGSIANAVHGSNPCHLIVHLHALCHALSGFRLLNDKFKAALCLLVQIRQISPQFTAENKVVKADRVMFFKIFPVQPSLTTNRSGFFWQTNIGNIVIAATDIVQFLHHMYLQ